MLAATANTSTHSIMNYIPTYSSHIEPNPHDLYPTHTDYRGSIIHYLQPAITSSQYTNLMTTQIVPELCVSAQAA